MSPPAQSLRGGRGAVCRPPWADTCISELLRWAAEAGHFFTWEIRKALKPLLPLHSSQAMLCFDLKSFCLCDLPRYLTQAAYPSFSLSLQQGCQCACVKKGCAGFFLLQAKVQTKATFSLVGMKRFPCFPLQQCYLSKACYLACLSSREWSSEGQNVYVIPQVS